MKTLQILFGLGTAVALMVLNVATAEIASDVGPITYSLDTGYASYSMPDISFDRQDSPSGQEAQATCAMTPGAPMPNFIPEQPIIPVSNPEYSEPTRPVDEISRDSLRSPPPYDRQRRYPLLPPNPPNEPDTPPSAVPEPTTLVLVGLGIGGIVAARRRWNNFQN